MGDNLPILNFGAGRTAKYISRGNSGGCAILDDDSLKCWGYNELADANPAVTFPQPPSPPPSPPTANETNATPSPSASNSTPTSANSGNATVPSPPAPPPPSPPKQLVDDEDWAARGSVVFTLVVTAVHLLL